MSDFTLRKRYEAILLRLKSQQTELMVQITSMLEDPNASLDDIQELVEDYTQIEGAFITFKQTIADYINSRVPPPVMTPPVNEQQKPESSPETQSEEKPTIPLVGPGSPKVVEENNSPIHRRAAASKKRTQKKKADKTPEEGTE